MGKKQIAVQSFQKATELDPELKAAWEGLADAQDVNGRTDLALAIYQQLGAKNPGNAGYQLRLGQLNEEFSNWEEAIAAYEKALALDPNQIVAANNLAWLYTEHDMKLEVALKLTQQQ